MKKILVLGAGLSSSTLIKYLLENSLEFQWKVVLGDISTDLANKKINSHPNGQAIQFDVNNQDQRAKTIKDVDVVISMLPASLHYLVAKDCIEFSKHMITASYVSKEISALDSAAKEKNLLLLNEIGVDPGIDHMSAMMIIDRLKSSGAKLTAFESYTGGLVAPEHDNNPWNYKITWNPRNVVLAGQGVSKFLHNGHYKYIPYHRLFNRTEIINVPDVGEFEVYPNRDSLKYMSVYGLDGVETMFRGTMRRPGYSTAWNVFVQLGITDDTYTIEDSQNMTYHEFIDSYLPYEKNVSIESKLAKYMGIDENGETMRKLVWSGIFEHRKIGKKNATPAQILQSLIEPKWQLSREDRDMIVMQHKFEYEIDDIKKQLVSSLVVKGKDEVHTAMSITVGIPVAIAAKLLMTDKITLRGVKLPIEKEIYIPVLEELQDWGIKFVEEEKFL